MRGQGRLVLVGLQRRKPRWRRHLRHADLEPPIRARPCSEQVIRGIAHVSNTPTPPVQCDGQHRGPADMRAVGGAVWIDVGEFP
jgi:hypothetical protein